MRIKNAVSIEQCPSVVIICSGLTIQNPIAYVLWLVEATNQQLTHSRMIALDRSDSMSH